MAVWDQEEAKETPRVNKLLNEAFMAGARRGVRAVVRVVAAVAAQASQPHSVPVGRAQPQAPGAEKP